MKSKALKYVLDIESVLAELDLILIRLENNYHNLEADIIAKPAIERNFEIIGEALRNLKEVDPSLEISNAKSIIGLRNLIAHSYDSVDNQILWGILINHVPRLKKRLNK